MSRVTIGGLEDLGYVVDFSQADPFPASSLNASCRCNAVKEGGMHKVQTMFKLSDLMKGISLGTKYVRPPKQEEQPPTRRRLSTRGRARAIAHGKKLLRAAHARKSRMSKEAAKMFVADRVVSVLYREEGHVYAVEVFEDMDDRRL